MTVRSYLCRGGKKKHAMQDALRFSSCYPCTMCRRLKIDGGLSYFLIQHDTWSRFQSRHIQLQRCKLRSFHMLPCNFNGPHREARIRLLSITATCMTAVRDPSSGCVTQQVCRAGEKKILQLWLPSSSSEFQLKSSWYSRRIHPCPWSWNYTFWLICQSDGFALEMQDKQ
jgi:hypothetical protein